MRHLVRTDVGLVLTFVGAMLVTYVGIALFVADRERLIGVLVLGAGVWSLMAAPITHDRIHREQHEPGHAVWGRDERRKPTWWPLR